MSWLAVNPDKTIKLFEHKPQRYKKPVLIESAELEEDYHGHFYHPMIESGQYVDVWAVHTNYHFDMYINVLDIDCGETIKHTELFSDIIKNMSWEDEPVEL